MTDQPPGPGTNGAAGTLKAGAWPPHFVRAGSHEWSDGVPPTDPATHRAHVEPWLAALLQAEHLALLVGSGLTTAVALKANAPVVDMTKAIFVCPHADAVEKAARLTATSMGRGEANIEDQIRAVRELIAGLRVLSGGAPTPAGVAGEPAGGRPIAEQAGDIASAWEAALDDELKRLLRGVLATERGIGRALEADSNPADRIRRLLGGFLLTFASRTATRERLHIFTTNYDRLIEYGCDLLGLRVLDRFVGTLAPIFRSSRMGVDLHYNPPGIRGEPRYLEGVVRLSKLHGSIDWRREDGPSGRPEVKRYGAPFGAAGDHPAFPARPGESLLIYPNPAKDIETLEYPYAEMFRDFAAVVCQPNVVLVTYGYGFGDDHVNRVIRDMLTVPSTHLVVLSYNDVDGRLPAFCEKVARDEQITLLVGSHFGDLSTLVDHYLPKPAIDRATWRMVELLNRRMRPDIAMGPPPAPGKDAAKEDL